VGLPVSDGVAGHRCDVTAALWRPISFGRVYFLVPRQSLNEPLRHAATLCYNETANAHLPFEGRNQISFSRTRTRAQDCTVRRDRFRPCAPANARRLPMHSNSRRALNVIPRINKSRPSARTCGVGALPRVAEPRRSEGAWWTMKRVGTRGPNAHDKAVPRPSQVHSFPGGQCCLVERTGSRAVDSVSLTRRNRDAVR
jgi:hypothetical protein